MEGTVGGVGGGGEKLWEQPVEEFSFRSKKGISGGGKGRHYDRKCKSGGRNAPDFGRVMLIGSRSP